MTRHRLMVSLGLLFCLFGGVLLLIHATDTRIFFPRYEYAHIRMRLLVEGEEVDVRNLFLSPSPVPGACIGKLQAEPMSPVQKDPHSVRLMWKGLTGQDLFRFIGFTLKGEAQSQTLGYSVEFPYPKKITIPNHTEALPAISEKNVYIFVRSGDGYIERPLSTWLHDTLEINFGRNSQIRLSLLLPAIASAHETEETRIVTSTENNLLLLQEQEEARVLNNILGDAVIYIQENRPQKKDIEKAFATFPLIEGGLCDEAT